MLFKYCTGRCRQRLRSPLRTYCRGSRSCKSAPDQCWSLDVEDGILHPAPDRYVIDSEATLLQQLLNIAQRERIAKIPPDRTKDDAGFGLPPFEDRRSGYHLAIVSRHQPA